MSKKCRKCGTENSDIRDTCENCGEVLSSEVSVSKKKLPNSLKILLVILLMIPLIFFVMDYFSPQSQMIRNIRRSDSMSYITVCNSIDQVFNTKKSQEKLIKLLDSSSADTCGKLLRAFEANGLRSKIIKDYVKERFFHIESMEDLHNIQKNTIKCFGNCNYYLPEIQVSKNIFNEYLSQYEEPITYENGKGGYYDEHKEENENRNIHSNGDIYDTKWEYYGDFALKHYKKEYVDTYDFYKIKKVSGEAWFFRGYSMGIDDVFIESIRELRYADSNFMLINEDNVKIAVEYGGIIKLILID